MDDDRRPALPRLARSRAERAASAVLPASGAVWAAAEVMHWAGHPGGTDTAVATAVAASLAFGASGHWGRVPRWVAWNIAGAGAWLSAAVAEGPLHWWPYAPLTWGWAVTSFLAWRWARRHPLVLGAQEWRAQRAEWLSRSHRWGLGRSHLLGYEETRLGEAYEVDVKGTGKRSSQIAGSPHLAELIAEQENLPAASRVSLAHSPGRVRISIRRTDPWAKPVLHPLVAASPETDLSGPYSITKPLPVGQDPETGRVLGVPLWDDGTGGKNVFLLSIKGGGKGVLLDGLSERITAAPDAIQVRVNLSVKGPAEAERWGPACHLTAFGTRAQGRAARVLAAVGGIIEWRSQRYATGQYDPSPADPLVVVIFDESDAAMGVQQIRKLAEAIATKGREYGVCLVRAGQRGTADYGSAKIRSQDDVFCVGKVNRQGEVYHAAGSMGFALPDMASYGEGSPGVWAIAELGGGCQLGRTWILGESRAAQAAAVARIARERAFSQPELPAECRAFLGESYEVLLSTDVFAEWARDQGGAPDPSAGDDLKGGMDSPLAALAIAVRDGHVKTDSETSEALLSGLAIAEEDALRRLDFDMDIDDADRTRLAELDAKNARTQEMLAGNARMREAAPKVPAEKIREHAQDGWREEAENTVIPAVFRERLLALLAGEGMSGRKITAVLAQENPAAAPKRAAVMLWLGRLRWERVAYIDGKGPGARWKLTGSSDAS